MLYLKFGVYPDIISIGGSYFDNWVDPEVLLTDFSKKAVAEIDKSTVVDVNLISSPILGAIPPRLLSGGVKTLMTLKYTDSKVHLASMGDNCFRILKEIADEKDIYLCSDKFRRLFDYGFEKIILITDEGNKTITSGCELMDEYIKVMDEV